MRSLNRGLGLTESWLTREMGGRFRGTIFQSSANLPAEAFSEPRLLLRVRPQEIVSPTMTIVDAGSRRYIVANHDLVLDNDTTISRTFRLYRATHRVSWKATTKTLEPVTGLPRDGPLIEKGPIWAMIETFGKEEVDRSLHIGVDRRRLITGASIALGDQVDNGVVKRLTPIYGIWLAEIQ